MSSPTTNTQTKKRLRRAIRPILMIVVAGAPALFHFLRSVSSIGHYLNNEVDSDAINNAKHNSNTKGPNFVLHAGPGSKYTLLYNVCSHPLPSTNNVIIDF